MSLNTDDLNAMVTSAKNVANRGAKSVQSGDQKVEFFPPKDILVTGNALKADSDPDGCFLSCTFDSKRSDMRRSFMVKSCMVVLRVFDAFAFSK
jgi:hypothetical protein